MVMWAVDRLCGRHECIRPLLLTDKALWALDWALWALDWAWKIFFKIIR